MMKWLIRLLTKDKRSKAHRWDSDKDRKEWHAKMVKAREEAKQKKIEAQAALIAAEQAAIEEKAKREQEEYERKRELTDIKHDIEKTRLMYEQARYDAKINELTEQEEQEEPQQYEQPQELDIEKEMIQNVIGAFTRRRSKNNTDKTRGENQLDTEGITGNENVLIPPTG